MTEPVITDSARRHGVEDDAMLHAHRNHIAYEPVREDFTMFIGPDSAGALLEVGVVETAEGEAVIIHAMAARTKYLKHLR